MPDDWAAEVRKWLRAECGVGTEDTPDPTPAVEALQRLLPLYMQAAVFDEETRQLVDTGAGFCAFPSLKKC